MFKNWTLVLFMAFIAFASFNAQSETNGIDKNQALKIVRKTLWLQGIKENNFKTSHQKKVHLPEELLVPVAKFLKATK